METDQKVSVTHALTQAAMAESTILGVKSTAIIKAAYETAESIAAFARLDFRAGAMHATAAAEYAALAATASSGASSGGGNSGLSKSAVQGASTGAAGSASAAVPPPLAPGAQPAAASGRVTVMVAGDTQAAQWIAGVLNKGVATKSVRLVSSHTLRPAPAVRSG